MQEASNLICIIPLITLVIKREWHWFTKWPDIRLMADVTFLSAVAQLFTKLRPVCVGVAPLLYWVPPPSSFFFFLAYLGVILITWGHQSHLNRTDVRRCTPAHLSTFAGPLLTPSRVSSVIAWRDWRGRAAVQRGDGQSWLLYTRPANHSNRLICFRPGRRRSLVIPIFLLTQTACGLQNRTRGPSPAASPLRQRRRAFNLFFISSW